MTPIRHLRVVETRKTYLPHILAIALLWSLAMTLDYKSQAESMTQQMAECLNGKWVGVTESGEKIGCYQAETWKPKG